MEPEFDNSRRGPPGPGPEPTRRGSHRRAHSDTLFRLPSPSAAAVTDDDDDDPILFDAPDFDFSLHSLTVSDPDSSSALPAASDDSNDVFPASAAAPDGPKPPFNHLRSFSMDEAFFDVLNLQPASGPGGKGGPERRGHRHTSSMDGFLSSSLEVDSSALDYAKKAMAPEKLAELALMDPKRAKRILANRQSAARSKERKIRYTSELERKVQTLQTEATTLSAQLTLLQRDTNDLTSENKELKLRLQAMEQQAHLQDALSEALRDEVQRLKIATGQVPQANSSFNRGLQPSVPQFFTPSPMLHQMGSHQSQQHITQPPPSAQPRIGQSQSSSVDFTRNFH